MGEKNPLFGKIYLKSYTRILDVTAVRIKQNCILHMCFSWIQRISLCTGVALGFKIRGCGWPLKQPEIKNWGSKGKLWGSLPAQEFPKAQKEGIMNDPKSCQKSKIGGHFCKMCAHDPMSPTSATPDYVHIQIPPDWLHRSHMMQSAPVAFEIG